MSQPTRGRKVAAGMAALVLGLALTACTDDNDGTSTTLGTDLPSSTVGTTVPAETTTSVADTTTSSG